MARKRRGNYGRVNMRQLSVFHDTDAQIRNAATDSDSSRESSATVDVDSSDSSKSTDATDYDEILPRQRVPAKKRAPLAISRVVDPFTFAAVSLFTNYETARSKFHVDIADLSILTNFNVGKSTIPILSADPSRLASILGYQQWYTVVELHSFSVH